MVIGTEKLPISDDLYIKMNENCESLNASVAASILMYELNSR